ISVTDGDNDTKVLDSMLVAKLVSWQEVLATRAELHADISAASRITLGVRKDGTVERSGGFTEGQWAVQGYSNIISAKAGLSHTLLLNAQRRVVSIGSNDYGEAYVTNWQDILRIEAGYNTSYAINLQGRVFAVGDNNYGQLNVAAWADIVSISAGVRHVAGVDKYGVVYTAGANTDGQRNISGINNAKAVACGATFTACLLEDGTVAVAGTLANADAVADWTDIIKLSAGENFIVGLKSDKTVVAAGVNNAGQCLVAELQDIIEIAAGEHHAAFLREDGMVLFTGSANGDYHVTEGIGNLIHDNYVYAEGIQFSMSRTEIYLGIQNEMSYALCSASVYPSSATYKKVTYLSADPSVATVSAGGTVIAVGSGTTTITAKVNGTDIGAEIEITVKEYIEIESIAFVDPIITIVEGNSIALMLVYAPSGATVYGEITYSSVNPTLATVNGNGLLTACGGYGEVTVSALLSQDGEQYSAECTVVIVSTVSGIEVVSLPTKTVYRYNEDFDESGGKIRITYQDQTTSDQSVVSSMISGYDKTQCGEQIITISYLDATATFSVTVQNYIKDAKLFSAGKTEYKYDESLDLNNMIITKEWADGSTTTSSLPTGTVVSGYDKNEVGFQTVTLTFELEETIYEVSYTVNVLDIVLYILGDAITKTTYLYGEPLRMTEPILMYMVSGAQKTIPLSDAVITGYDPMLCGVHPTKVEYFDIVGGQTHDFIIVFTVELAGQVNVYSVDSIGDRHLYLWPEFIYYTVGGALPIEVAYGLTDGRQIELGTDTAENIFYSIESFNAANNGPGSALIKLQYKRNKMIAGGEITTEVVSRYTELYVYGDGAFEIIDIGGEKTILYGQTLDLVVYTVDEYGDPGGGAPDRIVYDTELTGTPQTCTVYYRNKVDYTTITILDYVVELVPISDREIVYGESVELQVTGIKAKAGAVLLGPDEYEVTGLYTTQLGEHLVQVICGELTASFTLRVLDTIQSLTVNTPIASTCLFGQEPDFSSDYLCMMASGDTEVIAFNTNDFTVSSFDNRLMTTQTVRITHKQTGTEFRFGVTVLNYVASISVAAGAKTEYHFGEELSFGIVSIMANEVMQTIELSDCTITGYNQYRIATQTVTVTYKGVSTTIDVTVQDTVASLILQRAPFETDYGYGQALSYIGGVLIIHYSSGDTKTYEGTAIGAVACSYNPKAVGKQTVTLSIGSATATFNVTVGAKQESTYCLAESSFLTQKENSIVYNHSMTAEELRQNLTVAEYLWARIKKANGQFLALNDMDDEILRSDDILQIVNQAGYVVLSYQLYLEGDANCDGVLDEDDVAALALGLISGEYDRDMTDYDKDGVFTLTDFVNWARKAAPPVSPLNQMAKAFINDGIGKKREELL
ncbi:MAG: bacterial Ig-like domain-containing protein, partial [Clostridia bacterium]|nr:bacterial Ig-like domain-containing protein [Clostridia bacterium]